MDQESQEKNKIPNSILYQHPDISDVSIRQDVVYQRTETDTLTMDIYYPKDSNHEDRMPATIFINGMSDKTVQKAFGCKLKDMGSYISWGRLTAASGIVAITYSTSIDPVSDIFALLQYIRQNASSLGIDESRIGIMASSAHVPNALSVLMNESRVYLKCAVMCYGYMLDLEKSTYVADASKLMGFTNPCAGKSVSHLSKDIPIFIARAGKDEMPHLNDTIDDFLNTSLRNNLPITFVNHSEAPHAFDLMHDSETTRAIIKEILAFMQFNLLV